MFVSRTLLPAVIMEKHWEWKNDHGVLKAIEVEVKGYVVEPEVVEFNKGVEPECSNSCTRNFHLDPGISS